MIKRVLLMACGVVAFLVLAVSNVLALPVGVVQGGGGESIVLFDEQRECQEGQGAAEYRSPRAGFIAGCWFERYGTIWLAFDDGDKIALPKAVFKFVDV